MQLCIFYLESMHPVWIEVAKVNSVKAALNQKHRKIMRLKIDKN